MAAFARQMGTVAANVTNVRILQLVRAGVV